MRPARTALSYTVPNWPPQGPPSPGVALSASAGILNEPPKRAGSMGSLSKAMRRQRMRMSGAMGDIAQPATVTGNTIQVSSVIASGMYAGYPTGTVTLGGGAADVGIYTPYDVNGNALQYVDPTTGVAGNNYSDTQPGLIDQASSLLSAGLGAGQKAATAAGYFAWGAGALILYMMYKESQTPEGRSRFGSQVKNTATGAARAAGTVAKAAIL